MIHPSQFWVYAQKNRKQDLERILALPCCYSIIHNSQDVEASETLTHRRMNRGSDICIYVHIYIISHIFVYLTYMNITQPNKRKKSCHMRPPCMNLKDVMLCEKSQSQKDRYCVIPQVVKFTEMERRVVAKARGWRKREA